MVRYDAELATLARTRAGPSLLELAQGVQPVRRGRASYREFAQQCLFVQRIRLDRRMRGLCWTATMQGINLPPLVAKQAKAKGVQRGVPDYLLWEPSAFVHQTEPRFVGLALEFKDPEGSGRPTKEQLGWRDMLTARGWRVLFPMSAPEAWAMQCAHLGLPD